MTVLFFPNSGVTNSMYVLLVSISQKVPRNADGDFDTVRFEVVPIKDFLWSTR